MEYFLGCDLSLTGSGLVIIDGKYNIIDKVKLTTPTTGVERLFLLEKDFTLFLNKYEGHISLACIESPSFNSGKGENSGGRLFDIGEWNGLVKVNLFKKGIHFVVASPLQVKKYILGKAEKGRNTKDLIMLDIYKKYGEEIRENNIADAYVLSRICHDFYLNQQGLPTYQLEVIHKMKDTEKNNMKGTVLF